MIEEKSLTLVDFILRESFPCVFISYSTKMSISPRDAYTVLGLNTLHAALCIAQSLQVPVCWNCQVALMYKVRTMSRTLNDLSASMGTAASITCYGEGFSLPQELTQKGS